MVFLQLKHPFELCLKIMEYFLLSIVHDNIVYYHNCYRYKMWSCAMNFQFKRVVHHVKIFFR